MQGGAVRFRGDQRFPDVFIRGDHALDVPRACGAAGIH